MLDIVYNILLFENIVMEDAANKEKFSLVKDTDEAISQYCFYIKARDYARDVLRITCTQYINGEYNRYTEHEMNYIEENMALLFDELEQTEVILQNRHLRI